MIPGLETILVSTGLGLIKSLLPFGKKKVRDKLEERDNPVNLENPSIPDPELFSLKKSGKTVGYGFAVGLLASFMGVDLTSLTSEQATMFMAANFGVIALIDDAVSLVKRSILLAIKKLKK